MCETWTDSTPDLTLPVALLYPWAVTSPIDLNSPVRSQSNPAAGTGFTVTEFQATPNPNALKCILSRALPHEPGARTPRSYFNSSDAQTDPLATKFFTLSGVTSILITSEWVTVVKGPEAKWATLKPQISALLASVPVS